MEFEYSYVPCAKESDHHKFEDDQEMLPVLKAECPELFSDGDISIPEVCCSAKELKIVQKSLQMMTGALGKCTSCAQNFQELMCHVSCAPDQTEFVDVVSTVKTANGKDDMVAVFKYYVSSSFADGLYESCKPIPSFQAFMKQLGCDNCDTQSFLDAIGQANAYRDGYTIQVVMSSDQELQDGAGKKFNPAQLVLATEADLAECSPET